MWPMKDGYDYIAVNFGGYQLCKTLDEAKQVAETMRGGKGTVYSNGFHSDKLGKWIGKGQWFPIRD